MVSVSVLVSVAVIVAQTVWMERVEIVAAEVTVFVGTTVEIVIVLVLTDVILTVLADNVVVATEREMVSGHI